MNETTRADIAIIGTGPAGVSAAITARVRGKQVLLFGSKGLTTKMLLPTKTTKKQVLLQRKLLDSPL